jgi:hypothetical protein
MLTRSRGLLAAAFAVPLLLSTACSDGDLAADEAEETASGTPSTSPSESLSVSPSESGSGKGEMTAPGTILGRGDTATVFVMDKSVVAITVVEVETAPAKEMRGQLGSGETGWYAWLDVEVVSEAKGEQIQLTDPGSNVWPMDGDSPASRLQYSDQKRCLYPFEPADPAPGDTWRTCVPFKLASGQRPAELIYTHLGTRYDRYDGSPVVWRLDS